MELQLGKGGCSILFGVAANSFQEFCKGRDRVIITDSNVRRLYDGLFDDNRVVELEPGEQSKTLATVESIYETILQYGVDRSWMIVGFGGGVVCDIAGFVASTFMRGLPFGFIPTTLLAQTDAGVGGKNGVNLNTYKNIVGTINQPEFVLNDACLLRTLPEKEVRNGYAEVIKHAVIADAGLFSLLEEKQNEALALDKDVLGDVVYRSVKVKTGIVSTDEMENGERRKLNFGHTVGHALEKVLRLSHGEAVSVGMIAEAGLSVSRGVLSPADKERIQKLLIAFGLPITVNVDGEAVFDAVMKDKKRENSHIHSVLIEGIGRSCLEAVPLKELEGLIDDLCQRS
jgi:3-dehydroquinate synthase